MTVDGYPSEWLDLSRLAREEAELTLRDRFKIDPARSDNFTFKCGDLHVDFSRQHISHDVLNLLVELATSCGVHENVEDMFNGAVMNMTEGRPAAHVMLRSEGDSAHARLARAQRLRAYELADAIRSRRLTGENGAAFTDVVSIGIGGSDLGNVLVHDALAHLADGPRVHFVSNVDPQHFDEVVFAGGLDARTTLFVVSSKTFTTAETLHIAERAKSFLSDAVGDRWVDHVIATTASPEVARAWGVRPDHVLEFWDWVGGRFSVSSVIGFPLMVAFGSDVFDEFLAGMRAIDVHFRSMPLTRNVPALHAMIAVWNTSLKHRGSWAVIPYAHGLRRLPAYLQQLIMESNGKSVTVSGHPIGEPSSPVVWGEPGTNAQHSFFQMLHQGTAKIPVDFVGFASGHSDDVRGHTELVANLIAQASALAFGRDVAETRAQGIDERLVPHRVFQGNRPSTLVLASRLTPSVLGQLIAFYEHSTAVQGWIWNINSFDQWGVELGKHVASEVANALLSDEARNLDDPATATVQWVRRHSR